MLLCTKTHFIHSLAKVLEGEEGSGQDAERKAEGAAMMERIKAYATDATGLSPGPSVWLWTASKEGQHHTLPEGNGIFSSLCKGSQPKPGQRVVYVGGGFDLFSSGHIAFLRQIIGTEEQIGRDEGWYSEQAVQERVGKGEDYGPVFVVAGIHNDKAVNRYKGINYPIMNIYERGLCVLQCKVSTGMS
jgi:ethanolamine-phosphate cytidylyltransferase